MRRPGEKLAELADKESRRTALLAHNRSLLVEAGAGSGKTAIMAGRVALMLAGGIAPKKIAAVTFTELAASELLNRIREFATKLGEGDIPHELDVALPDGISPQQRQNLAAAAQTIDELTCTTIHGFCQRLITPYPVEADIDPGASIMDADQATLMFNDIVEHWLRETLDREEDSLLAELVMGDTSQALALVHDVLAVIRELRAAPEPPAEGAGDPAANFVKAAEEFAGFVKGTKVQEPESLKIAKALKELAANARAVLPAKSPRGRLRLLLQPPNEQLMTRKGRFRVYQTKGRWQAAARQAGLSAGDANHWFASAKTLYEKCGEHWQKLTEDGARRILTELVRGLRPVADRYREQKRAAALLDFEDLICSARDLVRDHDGIRQALAERFTQVLVDEFQDTDPLQAELFWRLCGDPGRPGSAHVAKDGTGLAATGDASDRQSAGPISDADRTASADWMSFRIRPGALFLVGDPKQAIYRFRGADVATYMRARDALRAQDPASVLSISTNFRSLAPILAFVNKHFTEPLATDKGQPGFTALDAFHGDGGQSPSVLALDIEAADEAGKADAEAMRDAEAERVAEMCARFIGSAMLREQSTDALRPCRPGDIALLAPTGTSLWRYEAALEGRGIPVATQAGKGLFRRQEVQDLIALTRVLADPRDSLAFGALLRGPLVGLTEEELLDIVWKLPVEQPTTRATPSASQASTTATNSFDNRDGAAQTADAAETGPPRLTLLTPPASIQNALARELVEKLQSLGQQANTTTPYHLLARAVDMLRVRPILMQRHGGQAERALANVDLFLSFSRNYAVRGLRAFADAMSDAWSDKSKAMEGRPDAQEEAVALYTMHAAKGLEWPIVMPVNTATGIKGPGAALVERDTGTFHRPVFGVKPRGYQEVFDAEQSEQARERVRLWYVAATRARALLVLPRFDLNFRGTSWLSLVDLDIDNLPGLDLSAFSAKVDLGVKQAQNAQTRTRFAQEAATIMERQGRIVWRTPSRGETTIEDPDERARLSHPLAAADAGAASAASARAHPSQADALATKVGELSGLAEEAMLESRPSDAPGAIDANPKPRGGRNRGLVLHKLMEEVLTGETAETQSGLTARARSLIEMLGEPVAEDPASGLAPGTLAETVLGALSIPEVAELRPRLIPEFNVCAARDTKAGESVVSGVVDAIAFDEAGAPEAVLDWKTDVDPNRRTLDHYRAQVRDYLAITGAKMGFVVLVTKGEVIPVVGSRID